MSHFPLDLRSSKSNKSTYHARKVCKVHQKPLLLPEVDKVILGDGDGEVEEVVGGVGEGEGEAPGLALLLAHPHLQRARPVTLRRVLQHLYHPEEQRTYYLFLFIV